MFFKRKNDKAVSPRPQAVPVNSINVNAVPLNDEKPILHVVYPVIFRRRCEERAFSVILLNHVCSGCKEEHIILTKNHNSALYACDKHPCVGKKLLKLRVTD